MNACVSTLLILTSVLAYRASPDFVTLSEQEKQTIVRAIPAESSVLPSQPRKLLVFNRHVRNGKVSAGHASIPYGNYALQQMGLRTGAYQTEFSRDIEVFRPERLKQFDAVCFNNTAGVLFDDPELRQSLLDFIHDGGGFVH